MTTWPVARLVDLGSGAGHVVIYAAALAPNVTATGHELAAGRHRAAVRARAALPSSIARRCAFVEGDMLRADLSRAVHESNCCGASCVVAECIDSLFYLRTGQERT